MGVVEKQHQKRTYRTGFGPRVGLRRSDVWIFIPVRSSGIFFCLLTKENLFVIMASGERSPQGTPYGGGCFLFVSRGDLTPLRSPEGSGAYDPDHSTLFFTMVTYEALFALGMLIIAIIELCSRKR